MIQHCLDKKEGVLHLKFPGDISSTNHDEIMQQLEKVFADPILNNSQWHSIVLDLVAARIIDSMGLNVVIALIRRAKSRNGTIRSIISSRTIYRTYLFTRLEKQMEIDFIDTQTGEKQSPI